MRARLSTVLVLGAAFAVLGTTLSSCSKDSGAHDDANNEPEAVAPTKEYPDVSEMLDSGSTVTVASIDDAGAAPAEERSFTVGDSPFGGECATDDDCEPGLSCLQETDDNWLGGGPPRGYCTIECSDDPGVCVDYDPISVCLTASDSGNSYCFEGCYPGPVLPGETKCHDRGDTVCATFGFSAACVPSCGNDSACASDRACDLRRGVCSDVERSGLAIGSRCEADENACEALCVDYGLGVSLCSASCTFGQPGQCGTDPNSTPQGGDPVCLAQSAFTAPGDSGLCIQGCNSDCDCAGTDTLCKAFTDPAEQEQYGVAGLCYPHEFLDIPPDAGSDGGALGIPCTPLNSGGTDGGVSDAG